MGEPLVVGVGSVDRGDDAAGVLVVRRLEGMRTVETRDCSGLIDLWDGEDDVTVVDAMRSGGRTGTINRFDALQTQLPARHFPSTHSFGLAETVELARTLGRLPGRLLIYGIEASRYDVGAEPSPEVLDAVGIVAAELQTGAA